MGFGIGSKKSKSSTSVKTTTQNAAFSEVDGNAASSVGSDTNNVTGAGNIGFRGSSNTVNVLDAGAVSKAFDFAESVNSSAAGSIGESVAAVTESARSETENIANQIKTLGIYAVVIWGGVQMFKAFKG